MALKETTTQLRKLLAHITQDLEKADGGNKAASQRVRTGTVKLEKVAKLYRKESIKHDKQTKGHKRTAKKAAKPKAAASKSKAHAKPKAAAKPKAKAKAGKTAARARAFSFKKPTAKLPTRRSAR